MGRRRVSTSQLKSEIESRLGHWNAINYFSLLTKFLSLKIRRCEFNRLCIETIGRQNVHLHNHLIRSIITNACLSKRSRLRVDKTDGLLSPKEANGYQRSSSFHTLCGVFPESPQQGRTPNLHDRKFEEQLDPLWPNGKNQDVIKCRDSMPKLQEQQTPGSVEDGKEVDQHERSPNSYAQNPITAPFGISIGARGSQKLLSNNPRFGYRISSCYSRGCLPNSITLKDVLEQKLEDFKVSIDCANLLNHGLDVFLKRLIKPCMEMANLRTRNKSMGYGNSRAITGYDEEKPLRLISASMLDFRVSLESNHLFLGEDWPTQLEKVCVRA